MEWSPERALAAAEGRAGVEIRTLTDLSDLADARWVFDEVWPAADGSTQVAGNLLKALVHAGGYASAAYVENEPVAAALGFVGRHQVEGHWHAHLHSHMAAVLEPFRDRHIGSALKYHQRVWCLERDLDTVVWTFDPLVRRNARLNLLKLGVDVQGFEVDFYGNMDDGINSGDPTDRLFAWWHLTSERAMAAGLGMLVPLDARELAASGRDVVEIELPEDIVALRQSDPGAAAEWRLRVRADFETAFASGYRVVGLGRSDGYLLERQS